MAKPYDFRNAYFKYPEQKDNVLRFELLIEQMGIKGSVYFANYEKAPWHVQAEINGFEVNFWPHTMKAYCEGFGVFEGADAVTNMIHKIKDEENVELVE